MNEGVAQSDRVYRYGVYREDWSPQKYRKKEREKESKKADTGDGIGNEMEMGM